MAMKICGRCEERPRRSARQRLCNECHAANMRAHRQALAATFAERELVDHQDCGPLSGVYFLAVAGFIKIGLSMDVSGRLRQIRTANPHDVKVMGFLPEPTVIRAAALELALHQQFWRHHHRGEWFHEHPAIVEYVAANTKPWPGPLADEDRYVFHVEPQIPTYIAI